ncbi:MAG: hypothetical protein JWP65_2082 [Ramlibacter sp.]|nr:hypothetical protein [Ramlibacter sp.]
MISAVESVKDEVTTAVAVAGTLRPVSSPPAHPSRRMSAGLVRWASNRRPWTPPGPSRGPSGCRDQHGSSPPGRPRKACPTSWPLSPAVRCPGWRRPAAGGGRPRSPPARCRPAPCRWQARDVAAGGRVLDASVRRFENTRASLLRSASCARAGHGEQHPLELLAQPEPGFNEQHFHAPASWFHPLACRWPIGWCRQRSSGAQFCIALQVACTGRPRISSVPGVQL